MTRMVEVTECRDCVYLVYGDPTYCELVWRTREPWDYCSRGQEPNAEMVVHLRDAFGEHVHDVYISGPVTGKPDFNRDAFERARRLLDKAGYNPVVPLDFVPADADHDAAMESCLRHLINGADAIYALDGYADSDGAVLELRIASAIGMPIAYERDVMPQ